MPDAAVVHGPWGLAGVEAARNAEAAFAQLTRAQQVEDRVDRHADEVDRLGRMVKSLASQVEQLTIMLGVAARATVQYRYRATDGRTRSINPREVVDYMRQGYKVEWCSSTDWQPVEFPKID